MKHAASYCVMRRNQGYTYVGPLTESDHNCNGQIPLTAQHT